MSDQLLLTVEDAARKLSIGRSRMWELLKAGEVESISLGRSRRIPIAALEEYVERLRAQQESSQMIGA